MEERRQGLPPITDFYKKDHTDRLNILWVAAVETWSKVVEMEASIRSIKNDLYVGDPPNELPIAEAVRNLVKFQEKFEYWAKFIGGALLLNFIGFAAGIVVAVVRFLPVLERLASKP